MFFKQCRIAIIFLILMTVMTGLIYPGLITLIGKFAFPFQANGSIIEYQQKPVGSALIGQVFTDPQYFWSRPSATSPNPYNAQSSSGSNLGTLNPALTQNIQGYIKTLQQADPGNTTPIPVELVTASGSGLDPDISPSAAMYQIPRVAKARNLSEVDLLALVRKYTQPRTFGILGEPVVNVLQLNLALDQLPKVK